MAISIKNKRTHISLLLIAGFVALILSIAFYNTGHSTTITGIMANIPAMENPENSTSTLNNEFMVELVKTLCKKVVSFI